MSPKAASEHPRRAPGPKNNDPSAHRRWNLRATPWTSAPGHPCGQPSLGKFTYNSGSTYIQDILLAVIWNIPHVPYIQFCCPPLTAADRILDLSIEDLPNTCLVLTQTYRWVFSTGPRLSQSAASKSKQPTPAMEHLREHSSGLRCMALPPGSHACSHRDKCGSSQQLPLRLYLNSRHKLKL